MRASSLAILAALAACSSPAVEQCYRFREALCARIEECGGQDAATCRANVRDGALDCDTVTSVSDPTAVDLCIEDLPDTDCGDLSQDPPQLTASCDAATFYTE